MEGLIQAKKDSRSASAVPAPAPPEPTLPVNPADEYAKAWAAESAVVISGEGYSRDPDGEGRRDPQ